LRGFFYWYFGKAAQQDLQLKIAAGSFLIFVLGIAIINNNYRIFRCRNGNRGVPSSPPAKLQGSLQPQKPLMSYKGSLFLIISFSI